MDAEIHNFNRDVYLYDTSVVHNNALRLHAVDYVNNTMMINLKVGNNAILLDNRISSHN